MTVGSIAVIGEAVPWKEVCLMHLAFFLLQLEIAAVCFGISACIWRGGVGIGLGLAIALYFMNIIANLTDKAEFLKVVSPFGYTDGADIISAGRLPFELRTVKQQTIGASLGEKSLSSSLIAGLIGLILVMLFMIAVYRLMGVISCIALVAYAALFSLAISIFHVNLSLPGIAGIILTIGMAVDANVIIFERIKEEIRVGKTLRYAIESGYKRALLAIIDANVTTIIAGAVMLWQGSGTILGFAKTLLIGVVLSMFVMLILTKALLTAAVGLKLTNLKLYCVNRKETAK
jgi:protein-export SecD/SecF family membrane protein